MIYIYMYEKEDEEEEDAHTKAITQYKKKKGLKLNETHQRTNQNSLNFIFLLL